MKKVKKAVIPVAGLGTRLLPATKTQPKEMLPIVDKPAVQYVVEEAITSGIESILFVTGRGKRAIEDYFDYSVELEQELENRGKEELLDEIKKVGNLVPVYYVRQKSPRGLGDAVYQAREFVGEEPFALILADDIFVTPSPLLGEIMELYRQKPAIYLTVTPVPPQDVSSWGVIKGEKVGEALYRVEDLVEKPEKDKAPSSLAIVGRYVLTPSIFEAIECTPPGRGGEIQLTDAIRALLGREEVYALELRGKHFGVGDKVGYLKANIAFALEREDIGEEIKAFLREILQGEDR
ncbi:MAG TPA: UTP--glucose-1-phosphate uridylyltransferase GalU [Candidatus Atribacteria bacterium]|nr:UTP--glucose-1-phosphate uridylyltransferase GalU [Candidatus Atribacteria bacterium]HPZ39766.1 UTP--glucose-1-phosphate uridylyltransferase GalU [Candidatus Atribacteria bacterium]HQD33055.1 UTP--glucose-1-phosphate uridylyltransferase GalU [Candidatus Atribacteria bacterium]